MQARSSRQTVEETPGHGQRRVGPGPVHELLYKAQQHGHVAVEQQQRPERASRVDLLVGVGRWTWMQDGAFLNMGWHLTIGAAHLEAPLGDALRYRVRPGFHNTCVQRYVRCAAGLQHSSTGAPNPTKRTARVRLLFLQHTPLGRSCDLMEEWLRRGCLEVHQRQTRL
jgi:hypothetical protein